MPRMKPDMLERFLQQPYTGVLATLRRDGRPYTVPVWWLWHEGGLWLTGTYNRVWCKQLMADPRCSLCIEGDEGHVEFDGRATLHELPGFDIWPISRLLAEKFEGRGDPARAAGVEAFLANMQTEPRLLFRIESEVRRAIDMTVYAGKRADREFQAARETRG